MKYSYPFQIIGPEKIEKCIRLFYDRAFEDILIGYFFMGRDKEDLILKQIRFTSALLGGPSPYIGQALNKVHHPLFIRKAHFLRREVILSEVLTEELIPKEVCLEWLKREKRLLNQILVDVKRQRQSDHGDDKAKG